jgi:6-phosphogluconolactonase (cycloisomerase 2 family)
VANNTTSSVSAYLIASADGSLTPLAGSPFLTAGTGPVSLSADPLGRFLYVANQASSDVSAFSINQTNGALVTLAGSPVPLTPAASSPQSITVDLSGQFAYVANASGSVTAFAINQLTGVLGAVTGSPFAAGLSPSAITTVGQF